MLIRTAVALHAIAVRAAAEGVGLYFSSGDTPGLTTTASDPYVVAVGGTTLGLGPWNNRVFETGWSNDTAVLDEGKWSDIGISGAGGGTSLEYAHNRRTRRASYRPRCRTYGSATEQPSTEQCLTSLLLPISTPAC